MIPRILVPRDVRPFTGEEPPSGGRRRTSDLDERIVIAADMPVLRLDGAKTAIPSHVPLDVVSARTFIPRDMPIKRLENVQAFPDYIPLSVLDTRVVVPRHIDPIAPGDAIVEHAFEHGGPLSADLLEVRDPDVITTGEVNLLDTPVDERKSGWPLTASTTSLLVHIGLIVLALFAGRLFPHQEPTQAQLDLARRQLSFVYLPPDASASPHSAPRAPRTPVNVSPDVLRRVAPTRRPELPPVPAETEPNRTAPTPPLSSAVQPPVPVPTAPSALEPPVTARRDTQPKPNLDLTLPSVSPGKALDQTLHSALKDRGTGKGIGFEGRLPGQGRSRGAGGGGGAQSLGGMNGGLEMLTPTEGVDFSDYFARLLASVKRNWYSIMPESAMLGDRGVVVLQFHIQRDGNVPFGEPAMVRLSGKEPLDRAAMGAIRASSPFEPLPPAFSGPAIELRFTFLYNTPLNTQ